MYFPTHFPFDSPCHLSVLECTLDQSLYCLAMICLVDPPGKEKRFSFGLTDRFVILDSVFSSHHNIIDNQ